MDREPDYISLNDADPLFRERYAADKAGGDNPEDNRVLYLISLGLTLAGLITHRKAAIAIGVLAATPVIVEDTKKVIGGVGKFIGFLKEDCI